MRAIHRLLSEMELDDVEVGSVEQFQGEVCYFNIGSLLLDLISKLSRSEKLSFSRPQGAIMRSTGRGLSVVWMMTED